jgi:hypothetical protein
VDGHPSVATRDGDHRVVLDVELFLVTDPIRPLDDQVGVGERRCDVALGQIEVGEDRGRVERVEDRRQWLGPRPDAGPGGAQRVPIGRGQQGDRLRLVTDLTTDRDEDRLVLGDARDDVVAGDVGRRDDGHLLQSARAELELEEPGVQRSIDSRAVPAQEDRGRGVQRLT